MSQVPESSVALNRGTAQFRIASQGMGCMTCSMVPGQPCRSSHFCQETTLGLLSHSTGLLLHNEGELIALEEAGARQRTQGHLRQSLVQRAKTIKPTGCLVKVSSPPEPRSFSHQPTCCSLPLHEQQPHLVYGIRLLKECIIYLEKPRDLCL